MTRLGHGIIFSEDAPSPPPSPARGEGINGNSLPASRNSFNSPPLRGGERGEGDP